MPHVLFNLTEKLSLKLLIRFPVSGYSFLYPLIDLVAVLFFAATGATIIFLFCRYYYRGVPISHYLDISLIPSSVLASLILYQAGVWPGLSILLITIFSVIHFHSVIKDTTDMLFVSWTLLSGLLIGAGYIWPTLIADLTGALIGLIWISLRAARHIYLLLIRYDSSIACQILQTLQPFHGHIRFQSEKNGLTDLTMEINLRYVNLTLLERINGMEGVHNAVLVSHEGNPD